MSEKQAAEIDKAIDAMVARVLALKDENDEYLSPHDALSAIANMAAISDYAKQNQFIPLIMIIDTHVSFETRQRIKPLIMIIDTHVSFETRQRIKKQIKSLFVDIAMHRLDTNKTYNERKDKTQKEEDTENKEVINNLMRLIQTKPDAVSTFLADNIFFNPVYTRKIKAFLEEQECQKK